MQPEWSAYYFVLAALTGLAVGSFLNVCIYRVPRDLSVVFPRSYCPECGEQISWRYNIPLLSYALLGGRAKCCGKPIGARYPVVEAVTASAFVAVAARYGWTLAAAKWMLFEALMITLFWTDFEERLLPDEFTLGGTLVGLALAIPVGVPGLFGAIFLAARKPVWQSLANAGIGALVLGAPVWILGALYAKVRKREGLGFGDVKLLVLMGVFLGAEAGLAALMTGAVGGSILGGGYMLWKRKSAGSYELPFGSFLCAGAAVVPLVQRLGGMF